MKIIKKGLVLLTMMLAVFAWKGTEANASVPNENVSITVPTQMNVVFMKDGSTTVSNMYIENNSLIPIEVQNVTITEFNDWEVVSIDTNILVNQKQVSFLFGEQNLQAGNNELNIQISEESSYEFVVTVGRGAWTNAIPSEKAMEMEFAYELGQKEFALFLDSVEDITIYAKNGEVVKLPKPVREGYEFGGWKDKNGNIYTDSYTMPIGNQTLTAIWNKLTAYALFASSDGSLTFVQSTEEWKAGQTHNGKVITTVYTGFEDTVYANQTLIPWRADKNYKNIKSVVVEDTIKPLSTAFWFYQCYYCMSFDLGKLDTSKVTDMQFMFGEAGKYGGKGTFTITGMDTWNMSNVTNIAAIFQSSGIYAATYNIGNVGLWDVSNVTNMNRVFYSAGMRATNLYIGDLSNWDTGKVQSMIYMFDNFGYETPSVNIGNIGKWDVSNVTTMSGMFSYFCYKSTSVYLGDLSGWNVSKVTDFSSMFYWCAMYVPNWNFGNLGKWNVSSGQRFDSMFANAGCHSTTFYLGTLQNWNTANATNMSYMFDAAGLNATWSLNCRSWNVKKVTSHTDFNAEVGSKVTAPSWVN